MSLLPGAQSQLESLRREKGEVGEEGEMGLPGLPGRYRVLQGRSSAGEGEERSVLGSWEIESCPAVGAR